VTPVAIGLGANLGRPIDAIRRAVMELRVLPQSRVTLVSGLYQSAPREVSDSQPDYINAVVELETQLTPEQLLDHLQRIESSAGRVRPFWHAARSLDLDILLFGSQQINTGRLTIPHPRLALRAFVLLPLMEIAPQVYIPGLGSISHHIDGVHEQMIHRIGAL
jgi:2-amino-4-hydroxy-6-hydroxymethyldihydropteridine diphosphokinase